MVQAAQLTSMLPAANMQGDATNIQGSHHHAQALLISSHDIMGAAVPAAAGSSCACSCVLKGRAVAQRVWSW